MLADFIIGADARIARCERLAEPVPIARSLIAPAFAADRGNGFMVDLANARACSAWPTRRPEVGDGGRGTSLGARTRVVDPEMTHAGPASRPGGISEAAPPTAASD